MHETLSKFYKGNIDSIKKEGKCYEIIGWVVPLVTADKCYIGCDGFVSVQPAERPDIYNLYKQTHINYLRSGFKLLINPSIETINILVNNEIVFKIEVEKLEHILTPNSVLPNIIVVDNFYENPLAVREYALKQEWVERLRQKRTVKSYTPHWMAERFETLLNKKISFTEDSGIFCYNTSKETIYHGFPKQDFVATIFLNDISKPETGIGFYKEDLDSGYVDSYDKSNFILIDKVTNKFNRLVVHDNKFITAPLSYCGNNQQTARLIQTFYFNLN